jgi:hypothetical protein
MAGHQGVSLTQLARFAGIGEARTSTRLTKLAERGLTVSPMCVPGRSWHLTGAGREIAMTERPLIDELDRQVLAVLAVASMGAAKPFTRRGGCARLSTTAPRIARWPSGKRPVSQTTPGTGTDKILGASAGVRISSFSIAWFESVGCNRSSSAWPSPLPFCTQPE